jgi:hypothetical protein
MPPPGKCSRHISPSDAVVVVVVIVMKTQQTTDF